MAIQLSAHIKIAIFCQDVSRAGQTGGGKAEKGTYLKDFG
jgi:hypothetical protein